MSLCTALAHLAAAPVKLHDEPPVGVNLLVDGVVLIDFGRVSFGNIRLNPPVVLPVKRPCTLVKLSQKAASTESRQVVSATRK